MTKREALVEARRRWGKGGNILHKPKAPLAPEREAHYMAWKLIEGWPKSQDARNYWKQHAHRWLSYRYTVGVVKSLVLTFFEVKGQGDTWDAAFADADERTQREQGEPNV